MSWSRKGAAVLLALVVVLTAVPALACFLPAMPASHACCRAMTMSAECGMRMDSQASCCQSRPADPASAPALLSSTEQSSTVALAPLPFQAVVAPGPLAAASVAASQAPPPKLSPGATTSLRI